MSKREYPERPLVGVGGVVIEGGRVLLVRRGTEPLMGQWSIPGGLLEIGETLAAGVARELLEETGLTVRVVELLEALDRIFRDTAERPAEGGGTVSTADAAGTISDRPRYHYVILDYLCERISGEVRAAGDAAEAEFVPEQDLPRYALSPQASRVVRKAYALARSHGKS